MVNILLEGYDIGADWLRTELVRYLKPDCRVMVVAYSFRDSRVRNVQDWERLYGTEHGWIAQGIAGGFASYGIPAENISFLNFFLDTRESAAKKIREADILYLPGGLPDRMMERILEKNLLRAFTEYDGIVMGYSAGAVLQLAEYHLSPDEDYPAFSYYEGLPFLRDFYLEVHYTASETQKQSIRRVISERARPVYALSQQKGAILAENGTIRTLGDVYIFDPSHLPG
ncbi:MAG: Type 1 glutamine amidotransferase-like domain-containing protein [Clostridia bacterium]|nr:Type 1 glutamine amidotransferase-like domain-containing protein [Clostridia bacterium]